MEAIVRATRRGGVILISLVTFAAALGLLSAVFSAGSVGRLSTAQLVGLLVVLVLPALTLGLLHMDRRALRERGGA